MDQYRDPMSGPHQLMPSFIRELAAFCRAKHGRVTQLADHLGIAQPHVSAWLTGRQEPSGEHTLRIQAWLESQKRQKSRAAPSVARAAKPPVPSDERATTSSGPLVPAEEVPVWLL